MIKQLYEKIEELLVLPIEEYKTVRQEKMIRYLLKAFILLPASIEGKKELLERYKKKVKSIVEEEKVKKERIIMENLKKRQKEGQYIIKEYYLEDGRKILVICEIVDQEKFRNEIFVDSQKNPNAYNLAVKMFKRY